MSILNRNCPHCDRLIPKQVSTCPECGKYVGNIGVPPPPQHAQSGLPSRTAADRESPVLEESSRASASLSEAPAISGRGDYDRALIGWLESAEAERKRQTQLLSNISGKIDRVSSILTFFLVMFVLWLVLAACAVVLSL